MESDHAMLNMNKYEWVTYNTLIDIGQSKALRISRESNVPHGKIYEVLESLKEKGLIDIIPLKIKEFIANDPEIILQLIEEKSHRIHSVKKNILQLKKTFEENTQIDNSDILIRQGLKGFYTILEMMEAPKNINYSVKWSSEYNREWAEKQKKQIDDGTDVKVLTRYDEETQGDVNKYLKYNKNIKRIENKSVALSIHDEEVLISLPQTNSTILIKDIAFTNLMQSFFNAKYKNSPEINIDKNSKIKTIKKYKSKEMINIDIINTMSKIKNEEDFLKFKRHFLESSHSIISKNKHISLDGHFPTIRNTLRKKTNWKIIISDINKDLESNNKSPHKN